MHFTLGLKKLPFEQVEKQVIYVESEYNEKVNYLYGGFDGGFLYLCSLLFLHGYTS